MARHRERFAALIVTALLATAACSDVELYPSSSLTLAPDRVMDAALSYDDTAAAAILSWTAPRTNGGTHGLRRYDIRFCYDTDFVWDVAEPVVDLPTPAPAGQREEYRFQGAQQGRRLSVAIRSIDVSGNESSPGNVATLLVPGFTVEGYVRDALLGNPLEGIEVTVTGVSVSRTKFTDATGYFAVRDLPVVNAVVSVASPGEELDFFPAVRSMLVSRDSLLTWHMIPFRMSTIAPSYSMLWVFKTAMIVRNADPIMRKWGTPSVDLYVPEYINGNGLDYRDRSVQAANRWMERTGLPLFRLVDSPPLTGVEMFFKAPADMGIQVGVTHHFDTPDGTFLRSEVSIVNTFADTTVLDRVLLHELGHTVRLKHLPPGFMMFGGLPLPNDVTDDEVWVVRLMDALPDRTDLSIYQEAGQ